MRIGLIGPVPPGMGGATPGGVATHQANLAEGLAKAGVDAPLLATNVPTGWTSLTHVPKYAMVVARERQLGSRRELLRNLLLYYGFLARVPPDVVHVQHPLERCAYVRIVREKEGWRMPLVVTAHSLFGEHDDAVIQTLMAPNLRAADRVIAVSDHIADQAAELGVARSRITLIRSGVDTHRFQPRDRVSARTRLDIGHNANVILFVGNLEPRKQVDVLLRATACLRERLPELVLLVVGSGESAGVQDQSARLRGLTAELQLGDAVRFLGRVDDRRLLNAYAAADVFALPSSSEAQGIAALEAMACGLPVVATAVGGLPGTIRDGESGLLVPPGGAHLLAERLLKLLCDRDLRQAIGATARRAVERDFSWQRTVEATIGVYREVLGWPPTA